MSHPVENIMRSTMEQLRQMVDVNTIVGAPIATGSGTLILPVSKVSMGFLSGGGEYNMTNEKEAVKKAGDDMDGAEGRYPFAGTAAAGMCLTPMAFVAIENNRTRVLPAQYKGGAERLIDMVPDFIAAIERIIDNANSQAQSGEDAQ